MPVLSKEVCGWIYSVWPSWALESQNASTGNSVYWSLGHSSRSSFHRIVFFPNLKHNFIAYRSSKVQIAFMKFTRVYSNSCCICSFEPEILKMCPSTHKMYSNDIQNFQVYTTIFNACTKKSGNLLNAPRIQNNIECYMLYSIKLYPSWHICCLLPKDFWNLIDVSPYLV